MGEVTVAAEGALRLAKRMACTDRGRQDLLSDHQAVSALQSGWSSPLTSVCAGSLWPLGCTAPPSLLSRLFLTHLFTSSVMWRWSVWTCGVAGRTRQAPKESPQPSRSASFTSLQCTGEPREQAHSEMTSRWKGGTVFQILRAPSHQTGNKGMKSEELSGGLFPSQLRVFSTWKVARRCPCSQTEVDRVMNLSQVSMIASCLKLTPQLPQVC